MKKKMLVTELLVEKGLTEKKLAAMLNSINNSKQRVVELVVDATGLPQAGNPHSKEEFATAVKALKDSFTDTLDNYIKICAIINDVNNVMTIDINGMEMSVRTALAFKNEKYRAVDGNFVRIITESLDAVNTELTRYNNRVLSDDAVNTYIEACTSHAGDINPEAIATLRESYIAAHKVSIHDPLNLAEQRLELISAYEERHAKIDMKLSAVNASTYVWVDLDQSLASDELWSIVCDCDRAEPDEDKEV